MLPQNKMKVVNIVSALSAILWRPDKQGSPFHTEGIQLILKQLT